MRENLIGVVYLIKKEDQVMYLDNQPQTKSPFPLNLKIPIKKNVQFQNKKYRKYHPNKYNLWTFQLLK